MESAHSVPGDELRVTAVGALENVTGFGLDIVFIAVWALKVYEYH